MNASCFTLRLRKNHHRLTSSESGEKIVIKYIVVMTLSANIVTDGSMPSPVEVRSLFTMGEEVPQFRQQQMLVAGAAVPVSPSLQKPSKEKTHRSSKRTKNPKRWKENFLKDMEYRCIEEDLLVQEFNRSRKGIGPSLILISGANGTGKSHLAKTIQNHVGDGFFVKGKFDVLQRPEPYQALTMALNDLTQQILKRDTEEIVKLQQKIRDTLDVSVLTNMVPSMRSFLTVDENSEHEGMEEATQQPANSGDAMQRFVFVMRSFAQCISSVEKPVVFLMDDLHYADECSLDILSSRAADKEMPGIVIVATLDDSAVSNESYLAQKLREIEHRAQSKIANIKLQPLTRLKVRQLLESALEVNPTIDDLVSVVYQQSGGNFFHIMEMLKWMLDTNTLLLTGTRDSSLWTWECERCSKIQCCGCLTNFLSRKLNTLSSQCIETLKVGSCFGTYINPELIGHVLGTSIRPIVDNPELVDFVLGQSVLPRLEEGVAHGILEKEGRGYYFIHEEMQKIVYSLIADGDRELFHLEIGRRLWRKLSPTELETHIFTVLSQIKVGSRLITRQEERKAVAYQCYEAGKQACRASAFRVALTYFKFGIDLLPDRSWRDEYRLSLSLYSGAAEMAMTAGKYEEMDIYLNEVFHNARNFDDQVSSYGTKIYHLSMSGDPGGALDLGKWVLVQLGEKFPRRLCTTKMISEFIGVQKLLKGKSDEQILSLPKLKDKRKYQILQILQLMVLSSITARPKFGPFVLLKMMRITIGHGLSVLASSAFATYGMLCIAAFRDAELADRYGKLALRLLERYKSIEYLPRVYAAYYGVVFSWKYPVREALEPLLRANEVALRVGDNEFAALCANLYKMHAIETEIPLSEIQVRYNILRESMIATRQETLLNMVKPALYALDRYTGAPSATEKPSAGTAYCDEMMCYHCTLQVDLLFNDIDSAAENLDFVVKGLLLTPPTLEQAVGLTNCALVAASLAKKGVKRRKYTRFLRKSIRLLSDWSRANPHNLLDRKCLLEAEEASLEGDDSKAYEKYVTAIALAQQEGFLKMRALSEERFARHLYQKERKKSKLHFEEAVKAYSQWGASGKVSALEQEVHELFPQHIN